MIEDFKTGSESTENENTDGFTGTIKIADDVVKGIVILAAADVRGVAGIAGIPADEIKTSYPGKNAYKTVKTDVTDDVVRVTLPITAEYGMSLPAVCKNVQEKIAETVENMTGLTVSEVNVNVVDVNLPQ